MGVSFWSIEGVREEAASILILGQDPTCSGENVCIIDLVTLAVSPRTTSAGEVFRTELWPRGPIMMMVCARNSMVEVWVYGSNAFVTRGRRPLT